MFCSTFVINYCLKFGLHLAYAVKFDIVILKSSLSTLFMSGQSSTPKSKVTICVMRHGMAEPYASQDSTRPLVDFGQRQALDTAHWLANTIPDLRFDIAFISPYIRAQQTFELVNQHISVERQLTSDLITPLGDAEVVHDFLVGHVQHEGADKPVNSVLLVSHMPFVSLFLEKILYSGVAEIFNTGGMAVIECDRAGLRGNMAHLYQSLMLE